MDGVDVAQRAALRAHDEGARLDAVARVADAAEPVAVGDAGGREEDVFATLLTSMPFSLHFSRSSSLRGQSLHCMLPPMHLIAQAVMMASGEPPTPMRRSIPEFGLLARPVEDDYRDVFDGFAQRARDGADVVGRAGLDVDGVGREGTGRYLVHVEDVLRVVHRSALGEGDDADGVRQTVGGEARSVDRVYGDVDLRLGAAAELLSVEEHRRFVFFAFSDDDDSVHLDSVEHEAHGVDGGSRRRRFCRRGPSSAPRP